MNKVFADTFYFLALLSRSDAAHRKAVKIARKLTAPVVTTAWVLTEVGDALAVPRQRPQFRALLRRLHADLATTIDPPSQARFDQGLRLYDQRPDKEWSLTDCISFVAMQDYGITEALTGDRHFEQAGFVALLK